ncbi:hypothetical protein PILCRDRAFT_15863 [Piloderma croceum F 1598]|uniref:Uncharacterized protein n=1 Tax=Piloderma croceum (strain F 1598) TaxID=765440 RepID=A0A0C3B604_PILCF|nr:hypothetical protein PILCRDRAFT_15863 [Piloderma croceum F 1598]
MPSARQLPGNLGSEQAPALCRRAGILRRSAGLRAQYARILSSVEFARRRARISSRSKLCNESHALRAGWSVYWSAPLSTPSWLSISQIGRPVGRPRKKPVDRQLVDKRATTVGTHDDSRLISVACTVPSTNKAKIRLQMTNTKSVGHKTLHHLLVSIYSSCVTLLLILRSLTPTDFTVPTLARSPTPHSEELHPGSSQPESYNETPARMSFTPSVTPCLGPCIPTAATAGSANLKDIYLMMIVAARWCPTKVLPLHFAHVSPSFCACLYKTNPHFTAPPFTLHISYELQDALEVGINPEDTGGYMNAFRWGIHDLWLPTRHVVGIS